MTEDYLTERFPQLPPIQRQKPARLVLEAAIAMANETVGVSGNRIGRSNTLYFGDHSKDWEMAAAVGIPIGVFDPGNRYVGSQLPGRATRFSDWRELL